MAAALPFIAVAATLAGTALSFKGQMDQQAAMGAQQNYLAQQARQRQMLADQQAADARQRGEVAVEKQRNLTAQRIGTQQAALAAQGTDLSGSPTDILGDTARAGEQDALTLRANAAREAYGYQVQGAGFGADATMRESWSPSYLGAGASLLSGASSLADKWTKFQQINPSGGYGGLTSTKVGGPDGYGGLG